MDRKQRSSSATTLHFEFISNNVMRWNKKRVKFMFPQRNFLPIVTETYVKCLHTKNIPYEYRIFIFFMSLFV